MSRETTVRQAGRLWRACLIAAVALGLAGAAWAQEAAQSPRPGEVETAPIQCWWRTDTTHVRIGERFTLTLTCGVIETSSLTVVARTNGLDPGALQLTPFEVVSGIRRDDILSPPWRYFQYEYRVRLLSEGFFGQDVAIPALPVTYNIQSTVGGGGQGRDQTYVLPALPMRIASLVPQNATDIRDANLTGFEAIESRRFRGTTATVAGAILIGFAGLLLVVGGVRATTRVRERRPRAARVVAPATVLNACAGTLAGVQREVASAGWSPDSARRALAAIRVAAAAGVGRTVAQAVVPADAPEREGQIAVRHGLVRRRRSMLSAATTVSALDRELSRGRRPAASRAAVQMLRDAIQVFTEAGYGRAPQPSAPLDEALSQSLHAVRQLRWRAIVPVPAWSGLRAPEPAMTPSSMSEERL